MIHIRSQVKTRRSQSYKFLKIAKNSNIVIMHETLHETHLPKLLDKIINIKWIQPELLELQSRQGVQDGRMDRQTDRQAEGRTDGAKPIYHPTTSLCRGYNRWVHMFYKIKHILQLHFIIWFHKNYIQLHFHDLPITNHYSFQEWINR